MEYDTRPLGYSRRIVLRLIDVVVGVVELLLGLRIVLELLGANSSTEFTSWLFGITDQLVAPFAGIFPSYSLSGQYVIDFSAVFAMLIYALLGWAIMRLISFITDTVLRIDTEVR